MGLVTHDDKDPAGKKRKARPEEDPTLGLDNTPRSLDEIMTRTGKSIPQLLPALMKLVTSGQATRTDEGLFVLESDFLAEEEDGEERQLNQR